MRTIQPSVVGRSTAPLGTTFVVMVGDEACCIRATGVRPIADVLAPPEAEVLAWEEMAAVGAIDASPSGSPLDGGMIAAPRARRRRDRATPSRALLLADSDT